MSGWMRPGPGDGVVIIVLIREGWVQASRDKAAHHLDRRTHSEPPRHCPGYLGVQPHKQIFYFGIHRYSAPCLGYLEGLSKVWAR